MNRLLRDTTNFSGAFEKSHNFSLSIIPKFFMAEKTRSPAKSP